MPSHHLSNKDIEKMKALAKGYEYIFDRHINKQKEWTTKFVEILDIIIEEYSHVNSEKNQKS